MKKIGIVIYFVYMDKSFLIVNLFLYIFVTRELANELWESSKLEMKINGLLESLLEDVVHPVADVQKAVSIALFSLLKDSPINATNIALKKLLTLYNSKIMVSFKF